jgi:transcriptional regulator with XRE-family HTH domain
MYSRAMTAAPEPLVRLAQYIERRITELALEYAEVCRRAGISDETLGKIRKGVRARGSTYRKLERALDWQEGSIAAILDGREPDAIEAHASQGRTPAESGAEAATLSSRELEFLAESVQLAAERFNLSEADLEEVFKRARVQIERRKAAEGDGDAPPEVPPRRRAV